MWQHDILIGIAVVSVITFCKPCLPEGGDQGIFHLTSIQDINILVGSSLFSGRMMSLRQIHIQNPLMAPSAFDWIKSEWASGSQSKSSTVSK